MCFQRRCLSWIWVANVEIKHYDFHYFILNHTTVYNHQTVFSYSAEPSSATPQDLLPQKDNPAQNDAPATGNYLTTAADRKAAASAMPKIADSELEGFNDDPSLTKVVDRRWYERNKHIYPASLWEDFDPQNDYSSGARKDGLGNALFLSR